MDYGCAKRHLLIERLPFIFTLGIIKKTQRNFLKFSESYIASFFTIDGLFYEASID